MSPTAMETTWGRNQNPMPRMETFSDALVEIVEREVIHRARLEIITRNIIIIINLAIIRKKIMIKKAIAAR